MDKVLAKTISLIKQEQDRLAHDAMNLPAKEFATTGLALAGTYQGLQKSLALIETAMQDSDD